MGSVKDLITQDKPENTKTGIGQFRFSNRYSVFDWGEMPDHFENKGKSLCITGAHFFEKLEKMGIKTHYFGVVEDDVVKPLSEAKKPTDTVQIKLLRVIKPQIRGDSYDYTIYQKERSNFLIPLEIIYRNSLPEGSSVFKRLKKGSLKLEDIGLERMPQPGEKLKKPILDVSTKLEEIDRYISWEEAQEIAGLTSEEIEKIKEITLLVNDLITKDTEKLGLSHEDGKIEFGFDQDRNLLLVDVLGTLDECRFTYNGIPVSKEIARIFYRNTSWFKEIEEVKKQYKINWKNKVSSTPPPLPTKLSELVSLLYQSFCNELTQRRWFETPSLRDVLTELKEIL